MTLISASSEAPPFAERDFLIGGGVMGELIRSKDWSATPLGPIDTWPQSLQTTVSLCLASNFPINIIWGPQHVQIYNDGYRPICAGKHPKSLGEDYTKSWASAWDSLDEAFQGALAGRTSYLENQRMFLDRLGYLEETFFTFSLSPIRGESGNIGGLFHPVTETTAQMLNQRRTRALQDLASRTGKARSVEEACAMSAEALLNNQLDLPFILFYLLDEEGKQARLIANCHLPPGTPASPEMIGLSEEDTSPWPLQEVSRTGVAAQATGLADRFGLPSCGPYPEFPDMALVLPVTVAGLDHPAGFLIAGVSPRLPFTEEYRAFLNLAAATLTAAVVNARSYEAERNRAEKLAELDRVKTAFFSNVSHEFRTPLTLMLGPLEEMLSHGGKHLTAERESVDLVHRNGLRLLRLVNTLLDFSRIEANRVEAVYEPVDLAAFTRDLASMFRATVEKAGISLEVNCPSLSEQIYVDREMWEKILLNLLSNAFKFTFAGTIVVNLREFEGQVELSVSDTGTGIAAHELASIFERFHRVPGAQGRTYEGTGIGLALAADLVKLHAGTIRVESQPGSGTTFHVSIPKGLQHLPSEQVSRTPKPGAGNRTATAFVEEAHRWLPDNASERDVAGSGQPAVPPGRKRILLADDNADMRQYILKILSRDFEVEAVADGAEALCAIQKHTPDLVLTDVMMPRLDGFGLLKELRNGRSTRGVPIIMLSARAGEESRVEGIQAGADDYLVKPFNARELVARVRVNLELADLRQELSREEEKRRSAGEMERQWRLFDSALSHTPDAISMFDLQGRLTYANLALLQRWQKSFAEVQGKNLDELGYPPEMADRLRDQIRQVIHDAVPLRAEASLSDARGRTRDYDYVLVPVFAENGEVEAVAVSTRDITDLREANRALSEANADLEQFAYSASHDLKSPLRVIDNASRWLEEDLQEHLNDETSAHMNLLRGRVKRMEKLLDDLLAYARIGRTSDARNREMIAGDALMNDILSLLSRDGFTIKISPEFPALQVCRMPLQQILMNLISNAIKHHDKAKGCIQVTVEDAGEHYVFAVKDDGPGIPVQFHDQIFKIFQTLKPRDQVEGSGMGLAIVRRNIEVFGGRLSLESSQGQGSTFRFTWPKQQIRKGTNESGRIR